MTPCESLGNNARYLDALADTTPSGLLGTPFGVVCDALRAVAASVWDADPTVYRAGIAWAWYLGARPSALAVAGFRSLLCAALVSECAPLVRDSQTVGELLALLTLWLDYRPVFADMEALFATYGVQTDVRAISDPEGQALLPVDDKRLAFYIFVLDMDWSRPMWLGDIAETARRASPLGARPFVVYFVEPTLFATASPAPTELSLWVDGDPIGLPPYVDVRLWLDSQQDPRTFSAGGYLGAFADGTDAQVLALYGVPLGDGTQKKILADAWGHFLFLPIAMTDYQGTELASPPIADLYCEPAPADAPASLAGSVVIRSLSAYPLPDDPYYYDLYMWTCRLVPATSDVQPVYSHNGQPKSLSSGWSNAFWRTGPTPSYPYLTLSSDRSYFVTRLYSSTSDSVGFCAARVMLFRYGTGAVASRAVLANGGPAQITVYRFDFVKAPFRAYSFVNTVYSGVWYVQVTLEQRFTGRVFVQLTRRTGASEAFTFVGVAQCDDGVFEVPSGGSSGELTVYVF